MPYDGVVMQLNTYRQVRHKLNTADSLITSLKTHNDSLRAEIALLHTVIKSYSDLDSAVEESSRKNQKSFNDLNDAFNKLLTETTKPVLWYQKPKTVYGAGVVTGIVTVLLIRSLTR